MFTPYDKIFKELTLDDYVAVKQAAYDYVTKGNSRDLKTVNAYLENVLDIPLDDKEGIVFSSTVLLPCDKEICDYYNQDINNIDLLIKENPFYSKVLLIKKHEIEVFHLDKVIKAGALVPPKSEDPLFKSSGK